MVYCNGLWILDATTACNRVSNILRGDLMFSSLVHSLGWPFSSWANKKAVEIADWIFHHAMSLGSKIVTIHKEVNILLHKKGYSYFEGQSVTVKGYSYFEAQSLNVWIRHTHKVNPLNVLFNVTLKSLPPLNRPSSFLGLHYVENVKSKWFPFLTHLTWLYIWWVLTR